MAKSDTINKLKRLLRPKSSEYETNPSTANLPITGLEKLTEQELEMLQKCIEKKFVEGDTFHWREHPLPAILFK